MKNYADLGGSVAVENCACTETDAERSRLFEVQSTN